MKTHPLNVFVRPNGWPMRANEIYALFGYTNCPPADFDAKALFKFDGGLSQQAVWIQSRSRAKAMGRSHRAITCCPSCGRTLTIGCLNQHLWACVPNP